MSEQGANPARSAVLATLLSSNANADVLLLFRRNPGLIDTVEGISRRLGMKARAASPALSELEGLAIIQKKKVGRSEVYFLDRERDAEAQREVGSYIANLKVSKPQ